MHSTRRHFLATTGGILSAGAARSTRLTQAADTLSAPLYEGYLHPPGDGVKEVTTVNAPDGGYWTWYGVNNRLVRQVSRDGGRTWSEAVAQMTSSGEPIPLARDTAHLTMLTLKSGALAIVYGAPAARPGRDGTVVFRRSDDGGATWSAATAIDSLFAVCRTQAARVLSTGRIVVPVMKWISPFTGGDSEGANKNLTYSWVYYSDDDGETWQRSLSELFIALDEGRRGVTHFEETVLEELPGGKLLMFGRTELGQIYQTYSEDGGISWKHPVPTGLASSYAPSTLIRIPQTGDLLLVWNQVSAEEILTGLHRHRLSTAISKDQGATWKHFRNLESLDNRVRITAPTGIPNVIRMKKSDYRQPDPTRYPHAPGCLRICYATVAFSKHEAAITYDFGYGVGALRNRHSTRIKILPFDWLYGRP